METDHRLLHSHKMSHMLMLNIKEAVDITSPIAIYMFKVAIKNSSLL